MRHTLNIVKGLLPASHLKFCSDIMINDGSRASKRKLDLTISRVSVIFGNMKNIVIVGFMGTGKTVVAKILARKLGREFLELDAVIEKNEGMSIRDIFEKKGEPYFRKLEKDVVKKASARESLVISAGGGAIIDEENLNNLRKNSIIICLEASSDVILKRTKGNVCRPLLNVPDPKKRIEELLRERAPYYKKADRSVNTDNFTPDQVAEKIFSLVA